MLRLHKTSYCRRRSAIALLHFFATDFGFIRKYILGLNSYSSASTTAHVRPP